MEWPLDLPVEFLFCKSCETPQELLQALKTHSDEQIIHFIEWIAEDEIWSAQNKEFLIPIFKWLGKEFMHNRLAMHHAERIVQVVHHHFQTLIPSLDFDVFLKVEDQTINACSLLYGACSLSFLQLMRKGFLTRRDHSSEKITIPLRGISFILLEMIHEYILTDRIQKLSQSKEQDILNLLREAVTWKVAGLAELCAGVFKRYLNCDNMVETLLIAHREGLPELKQAAFDFIQGLSLGLRVDEKNERELAIEIVQLKEEGLAFLSQLAPYVTHLICHSLALTDEAFAVIIPLFIKLKSVDFSRSEKCLPVIFESIVNVDELTLSQCPWVDTEALQVLIAKSPRLTRLDLADNEQMELSAFFKLSALHELLVLSLANCHGADNMILLEIATGCPKLIEFTLTDSQRVGDEGVINFAMRCKHLRVLNLSECHELTERGLIRMAEYCPHLQSLVLRRCRGVTDNAIIQIAYLCPELRFFDVSHCPITSVKRMEDLQKMRPYMDFKF